jgi:HD superfamily phosphohydrolase
MSEPRTQRVRDPVHGLIIFRYDNALDQLAWRLLDAPEFQRLRRIKQLGFSDFVFPSATHSRFAHCIGVFHTARKLVEVIDRERNAAGQKPDERREEVAIIAALLHDLGHGPFSHTFEGVQKSLGVIKRHEQWTAEIIRNPAGGIRPLLDAHWPDGDFCEAVAGLLEDENPQDIYHAIVSSSFDADRLDYLRRDRLMTGTGAGAIDFDWLMEQVRVEEIEIEAPDAGGIIDAARVPTFCFDRKALPAAEQFLLARYTLHEQVYFHKTTRCLEQMIAKLLRRVSLLAGKQSDVKQTGLDKSHPLIRFFAKDGATLKNYLALDDVVVMDAVRQLQSAPDTALARLAIRLRERDLYKTVDLGSFGYDEGVQRGSARRIDRDFFTKIRNEEIIKDESAAVNIYTQIGGDDEKAHKRLHILDAKKGPVEITEVSKLIDTLSKRKSFTRYYFEHDADRDAARQRRGDQNDGS